MRAVGTSRVEAHPRRAGASGDPGPAGCPILRNRATRNLVRAHAQGRLADRLRAIRRTRTAPGADRTDFLSPCTAGRHEPSDAQPADPGPLHSLTGSGPGTAFAIPRRT